MLNITELFTYTFLFVVVAACGGRHSPFLDRTIKGPIALTPEWIEITTEPSLKTERDVQGIVLNVDKPYEGEFELEGIRLLDGSLINPEVQLVDAEGKSYNLKLNGQFGQHLILYSIPDRLKGKEFRKVRIRSGKPIYCKRILWRCYYVKDIN